MSDTELTVSPPLVVRVDTRGLDFNGLVRAIGAAAAEVCGQLLGQALRPLQAGRCSGSPDAGSTAASRPAAPASNW